MVEHHLAGHRRDPVQAHETPQVGQTELGCQSVCTVHLNGRVEAGRSGLGGEELRHVRFVSDLEAGIEAVRRSTGQHPRRLECDCRPGQRMRHALMGADRPIPHDPLVGVGDTLVEAVPREADADGR